MCKPLQDEHFWAVKNFKTRQGVAEYYIAMVGCKYLEPLWSVVDTLREWHRFSNVVGLTTSFSSDMRNTLSIGDDSILLEDQLCATIWRLVANLLTERIGSCQYLSAHYPGALAGLLGSAEQKKRTLQFARIAKRGEWRFTQDVHVRVFFDGLNQEDILEDTLGKARDTEYRDASSRVLRLFKAYEVPVDREQLRGWDREEVTATPELPNEQAQGDPQKVFFGRERAEMDMKGVVAVGAQQTWQAFTPQSLRSVPGSKALLQYFVDERQGDYIDISAAWKATVVPKHRVVPVATQLPQPRPSSHWSAPRMQCLRGRSSASRTSPYRLPVGGIRLRGRWFWTWTSTMSFRWRSARL